MYAQTKRKKTAITREQAVSLLYPIAAFYNRLGLSRSQSIAALKAAIDDVRGRTGKRLENIGIPTCYADVIATWTRERRFLDSRGRPRKLTLSGASGFAALARSAGAHQDPKKILSVLIRYKNVRRLNNGMLQLVSPFFCATAGSKVAFEPVAYFLNDVTAALTQMLKTPRARSSAHHFWRTVESAKISPRNARKFGAFSRERSLIFLEELDDWLLAHSNASGRSAGKQLRVGLGLFSIHSH
jgi:hypothetical protein